MGTVGTHCILEMYDCPVALLNDVDFVKRALIESSQSSLATLLKQISHRFHPHGVTALGLLAESHISIHTWPEHAYAAADVFTCGDRCDPVKACQYLVGLFKAKRHELVQIHRGAYVTFEPQLADLPAGAIELDCQTPLP